MHMREQGENGNVDLSLLDTREHPPIPGGDNFKKYAKKRFRQSLLVLRLQSSSQT